MKTQTVYVVTTGEYSDKVIRGIYSTKKKAEEVKSKGFPEYSDANVFPMEVDKHYLVPEGFKSYNVRILKNDEIYIAGDGTFCTWEERNSFYFFRETNPSEEGYTICIARDKEHAKKIALDRYYKAKAKRAGIAL